MSALATDPLEVDFPDGFVSYASLMDILQYVTGPEFVEAYIARAARWARDFVFIRMPSFEDESYLRAVGLKFFWHDWTQVRSHVRLDQLTTLLRALGLDAISVIYRRPALSSDSPSILPLAAPVNQGEYDPILHGPKPAVTFPHSLFEQIDVYIPLRTYEPAAWRDITSVSDHS
jgi:hypothetical protein